MQNRTVTLTRTGVFAALLAVSTFIRIPLGPVPLTMQTFAVLVTGYSLGPTSGLMATLTYTLLGLAGLPVFTSGGGPAYVLSPTFGYIIGFSLSVFVTGVLAKLNTRHSPVFAFIIMLAGIAAIYIPGVLWLGIALSWIADVPAETGHILKIGLLVPLPGDLLTAAPAAMLSIRLRKMFAR